MPAPPPEGKIDDGRACGHLLPIEQHLMQNRQQNRLHLQTRPPHTQVDIMNQQLMAELFGGGARYKALRVLFEHPGRGYGARELAAAADIDPGATSRWLRRWGEVGLLEKQGEGRSVKYAAATGGELTPLAQLLRQDSDMVRVLRTRLAELEQPVQAAAIFGSVARGEERTDSDIDLLLITAGSRLQMQAHFKPAGRLLGRAVNVLTISPQDWEEAPGDHELIGEILRNPIIPLVGSLHAEKT